MIKFIQFYRDAWSSWGYAISAAEILSFYTTFRIKTKISLIHMRLHVCNTHMHTYTHKHIHYSRSMIFLELSFQNFTNENCDKGRFPE